MCVAEQYMHVGRKLRRVGTGMTVRKESAYISQLNTPEYFFSRYRAAHGRAQELTRPFFRLKTLSKTQPLVTWQKIAGSCALGGCSIGLACIG